MSANLEELYEGGRVEVPAIADAFASARVGWQDVVSQLQATRRTELAR